MQLVSEDIQSVPPHGDTRIREEREYGYFRFYKSMIPSGKRRHTEEVDPLIFGERLEVPTHIKKCGAFICAIHRMWWKQIQHDLHYSIRDHSTKTASYFNRY
ncbi:unnamed protein product [Parnassius apollo]|uniref:(apollo) hypothetical protein n=1 Tax=Parnassius apollo TaxID=110799 RepID=A0A8S3W2F1_PARAO|nr:unnamed protein product [Parnassius apollo]